MPFPRSLGLSKTGLQKFPTCLSQAVPEKITVENSHLSLWPDSYLHTPLASACQQMWPNTFLAPGIPNWHISYISFHKNRKKSITRVTHYTVLRIRCSWWHWLAGGYRKGAGGGFSLHHPRDTYLSSLWSKIWSEESTSTYGQKKVLQQCKSKCPCLRKTLQTDILLALRNKRHVLTQASPG